MCPQSIPLSFSLSPPQFRPAKLPPGPQQEPPDRAPVSPSPVTPMSNYPVALQHAWIKPRSFPWSIRPFPLACPYCLSSLWATLGLRLPLPLNTQLSHPVLYACCVLLGHPAPRSSSSELLERPPLPVTLSHVTPYLVLLSSCHSLISCTYFLHPLTAPPTPALGGPGWGGVWGEEPCRPPLLHPHPWDYVWHAVGAQKIFVW